MALRITKVYTRQGDSGVSRLGGGQEVSKAAIRIKTYGTVDELNSVIGVALSMQPCEKVSAALTKIQHELFTLGGELCVLEEDRDKWEMPHIEPDHTTALEKLMDKLNEELKPLEDFILPGGTKVAAFLHQARCVCRRAERLAVELSQSEKIASENLRYLNRLSDALFVLARFENLTSGIDDIYWKK